MDKDRIPSQSHELFRRLCDGAERFILTTHVQPDGDALGSEVGLARFLASRGKQVRVINPDRTPELLAFVTAGGPKAEPYDPARHDDALRSVDLIVLVDNSAPDRLGPMEPIMEQVAGRTLCIDHHPSRNPPWAHLILDEGACATTVMIYELARALGWSPDLAAAEAIYVGLSTDTGFFRYNSTDAKAYELAAELVRIGVSPARVHQAIYERNSLAYTRLLGHALSQVQVVEGAIASVALTRALIGSLGAADVDMSEIMTALLAMDDIAVALLFRELDGGRVKVSLRSKGALDVHRLAGEFGGGGHRNASGVVMAGNLDDVVRRVTERAKTLISG